SWNTTWTCLGLCVQRVECQRGRVYNMPPPGAGETGLDGRLNHDSASWPSHCISIHTRTTRVVRAIRQDGLDAIAIQVGPCEPRQGLVRPLAEARETRKLGQASHPFPGTAR